MGPLDKQVLRADSLTATDGGLDVAVYMHWYRALPLTSLAKVELWVDGEPVDPASIEVTVNQTRRSLTDTAEVADEYWFTTDPVVLHVPLAESAVGAEHHVRLSLGLSIPYILIGQDQTPLLAVSSNDKVLTAAGESKELS